MRLHRQGIVAAVAAAVALAAASSSRAAGTPPASVASGSFVAYGTGDSQPVAVPAAADRILVFEFAGKFGGDTLSSVTYAGQPLHLLAARDQHSVHTEIRYLVNPPAGTAALAWAKTGGAQNVVWGYDVYSGVDQTTPFGAPVQAGATNDPQGAESVLVPAAPGDRVVSGIVVNGDQALNAPPVGVQQDAVRWARGISTTEGGWSDAAAQGATTLAWRPASSPAGSRFDWALIGAALHPSSSSSPKLASTTASHAGTTATDVAPGTAVTDTATVTGAGATPTGSVTFFLCQPAVVTADGGTCASGGDQVGAAKPLDGTGSATSDATASTTAAGTYCWRAEYGGDAAYLPSADGGAANECFTVSGASSSATPIVARAAAGFGAFGTSDSQTVAVPDVQDRILVFEFAGKTGGDSLSSVTYGGQPLQLLAARDQGSVHAELRYLLNPPAGSAQLAWTKTGSAQNVTWGYEVYSNVNQATPFGTPVQDGATQSTTETPGVSVSLARGDLAVDVLAENGGSAAGAPHPFTVGQASRWAVAQSTVEGGSSDKPGTGPTAMTWALSLGNGTRDWAAIAAALHPASTGAGTLPTTLLLRSVPQDQELFGTRPTFASATVTGSGTPTGTVTFFLCSPATVAANGGTCASGGDQVGSPVTLDSSGQADSAETTTTAFGTYCWRGAYSGDGLNAPSQSDGTTCFTTRPPEPGFTFTGHSAGSFATFGTSDSQAVTVDPFADRVLVFAFTGKRGGDSLSSVTYAGLPLTLLAARDQGSVHVELRYLVDPPAGTAQLAWRKSGVSENVVWSFKVYEGVDQANPFGAAAQAGATSDAFGTKQLAVPSVPGQLIVSAAVFNGGVVPSSGPVEAAPGGGVGIHQSTTQGGLGDQSAFDSTTVGWTPAAGSGNGLDWAIVAAPMNAAP